MQLILDKREKRVLRPSGFGLSSMLIKYLITYISLKHKLKYQFK